MLVSQVMTPDPITVPPEMSLKDVARLLQQHRVTGVPVVAAGRLVGVVSTGDVLSKEQTARTAGEAMTSPASTIAPSDTVATAARIMLDRDLHRLPVTESPAGLVGIVTRTDLLRAFARNDAEIEHEIRTVIRLVEGGAAAEQDLEVSVTDGDVELAGLVDSRITSELLPELVARVPGVVSVDARLHWNEAPLELGARGEGG